MTEITEIDIFDDVFDDAAENVSDRFQMADILEDEDVENQAKPKKGRGRPKAAPKKRIRKPSRNDPFKGSEAPSSTMSTTAASNSIANSTANTNMCKFNRRKSIHVRKMADLGNTGDRFGPIELPRKASKRISMLLVNNVARAKEAAERNLCALAEASDSDAESEANTISTASRMGRHRNDRKVRKNTESHQNIDTFAEHLDFIQKNEVLVVEEDGARRKSLKASTSSGPRSPKTSVATRFSSGAEEPDKRLSTAASSQKRSSDLSANVTQPTATSTPRQVAIRPRDGQSPLKDICNMSAIKPKNANDSVLQYSRIGGEQTDIRRESQALRRLTINFFQKRGESSILACGNGARARLSTSFANESPCASNQPPPIITFERSPLKKLSEEKTVLSDGSATPVKERESTAEEHEKLSWDKIFGDGSTPSNKRKSDENAEAVPDSADREVPTKLYRHSDESFPPSPAVRQSLASIASSAVSPETDFPPVTTTADESPADTLAECQEAHSPAVLLDLLQEESASPNSASAGQRFWSPDGTAAVSICATPVAADYDHNGGATPADVSQLAAVEVDACLLTGGRAEPEPADQIGAGVVGELVDHDAVVVEPGAAADDGREKSEIVLQQRKFTGARTRAQPSVEAPKRTRRRTFTAVKPAARTRRVRPVDELKQWRAKLKDAENSAAVDDVSVENILFTSGRYPEENTAQSCTLLEAGDRQTTFIGDQLIEQRPPIEEASSSRIDDFPAAENRPSLSKQRHVAIDSDTPKSIKTIVIGSSESNASPQAQFLQVTPVAAVAYIDSNAPSFSGEREKFIDDEIEELDPLQQLLEICQQDQVMTLTNLLKGRLANVFKLGEGSFAEVFRLSSKNGETSALKMMPIDGTKPYNGAAQKSCAEVIHEVCIAKEIGDLASGNRDDHQRSPNFIPVNKLAIGRGRWPDALVRAWRDFDKRRGSENDKPSRFDADQKFVLLEFGDGGVDLDNYQFQSAYEIYSVVMQLVCSLMIAESSMQFEHRDLHAGNILIRPTTERQLTYQLSDMRILVPTMGVHVSIIDFTLARITRNGDTLYSDCGADEELFLGEGDYQFDIYRKMRQVLGRDWRQFKPRTNLFWLDYVVDRLQQKPINGKRMKTGNYNDLQRVREDIASDSFTSVYCLLLKGSALWQVDFAIRQRDVLKNGRPEPIMVGGKEVSVEEYMAMEL